MHPLWRLLYNLYGDYTTFMAIDDTYNYYFLNTQLLMLFLSVLFCPDNHLPITWDTKYFFRTSHILNFLLGKCNSTL